MGLSFGHIGISNATEELLLVISKALLSLMQVRVGRDEGRLGLTGVAALSVERFAAITHTTQSG